MTDTISPERLEACEVALRGRIAHLVMVTGSLKPDALAYALDLYRDYWRARGERESMAEHGCRWPKDITDVPCKPDDLCDICEHKAEAHARLLAVVEQIEGAG